MSKLIDDSGELRPDTWRVFEGDAGAIPSGADVLMPLDVWREYRQRWLDHDGRKGIVLMPGDDLSAVAQDLPELVLVAVSFPSFTDGRGYSQARLLRERYRFRGEIRAVGDVLLDQLSYLRRCGFDAFALRADQDLAAAQVALAGFSHAYQAAVNEQPLFRRRAQQQTASCAGQAAALGAFGVIGEGSPAAVLPEAA